MYKIKDQYLYKGDLISLVEENGSRVPVNIAGRELKRIIPATSRTPKKEVIVRAATQSDLEFLYNQKNKFVEKVQSKVIEGAKAAEPKDKAR